MKMEKDKNPLKKYVESTDGGYIESQFDDEPQPLPQTWKEIDSISFPRDRWLVNNLFPKEGISILASVSGEGKSLITLHLVKCLSEGSPLFGCSNFQTLESKVLYINLEMATSEVQRRGRMIGFSQQNENFFILNESNFNLNDGETGFDLKYKWLLKYVFDNEIKVIIVDTLRPAAGGLKEEKAEEVRAFFKKFQILKNSGILIIFLEHLRKPSQFEGKIPKKEQLLGSQDKTANAETLIMIRKDESTGNTNIYQPKNRLGPEVQPFAIKISDVIDSDGQEKLEFKYVGELEEEVNKKEEAKGLILEILSSGEPKMTSHLLELTKKKVGVKNTRKALQELVAIGEIDFVKEKKQNCYFIPKEIAPEPLVEPKTGNFFNTS